MASFAARGTLGPESEASQAELPPWACIAGAIFTVGTTILFARLIWEETVWTWERGPQMVGFSLAHDVGALLFLFPVLLFVWAAIVLAVTIWSLVRKRRVSTMRWLALGAIALLFAVGSLPDGFWQRAFIGRMAASPRAGDLMLYAAYRGDLGTVQGLTSHGVPVNATDRAYRRTALHGAAAKGDVQTIRYLVSKGANVNAIDRSGDSPLELAVSNHQDSAAKLLVDLGALRIRGDAAQRENAIHDMVSDDINALSNR